MKRILIPSDFSEISKNSLVYGFQLAEKLGFEVHLVHVLELYKFAAGTSEAELISTILPSDNIREMEELAKASFDKLFAELEGNIPPNVPYNTKVVSGQLINEMIVESALDTELLVLAVAGGQDLISRFTHNTISSILAEAACPVLLVPSGAGFSPFKNVCLASDFNKYDLQVIDEFFRLFDVFAPKLEVLHIAAKPNDFKTELNLAGFKQLVAERIAKSEINYKLAINKNVVQGIINELTNSNANLLIMLREHEGFFKSLFETSKTDKIAHYLKIPMLSYHEPLKNKE